MSSGISFAAPHVFSLSLSLSFPAVWVNAFSWKMKNKFVIVLHPCCCWICFWFSIFAASSSGHQMTRGHTRKRNRKKWPQNPDSRHWVSNVAYVKAAGREKTATASEPWCTTGSDALLSRTAKENPIHHRPSIIAKRAEVLRFIRNLWQNLLDLAENVSSRFEVVGISLPDCVYPQSGSGRGSWSVRLFLPETSAES